MKLIQERNKSVTYKEARVYLDELSKYGSVLGLDAIRGLLRELGNPQDDLRFIHIAGTNGKGSVLAYTSTILSEAGYRIGRYVSPTVVSYRERIQVDGEMISKHAFAEETEKVQDAIVRLKEAGKQLPTVFEAETAIAFLYYKRMKCDFVVLESGLGGMEDATNVVKNTVCAVFSPISMDHIGVIGNTLSEIAENKAGIIKPGCIVVSAPQKQEVREILERVINVAKGAAMMTGTSMEYRLVLAFTEYVPNLALEEDYRGMRFSYKDSENISIRLSGKYQLINAVTAWEAVHVPGLLKKEEKRAVETGFFDTEWFGRFTCISERPVFLVDGAHNEDAAKRLRESIEAYFPGRKLIYIMGVFQDKEYEKIIRLTIPYAKCVYTVDLPNKERTLSAQKLKEAVEAQSEYVPAYAVGEIKQAVKEALENADEDDVILAFGSLSYLGKVKEAVEKEQDKRQMY